MEKYAENTASCLLYLQLESLNVRDVNADHIVSHIGKMIGITTLLRSIPFHASQKRLVLPAEITANVRAKKKTLERGHCNAFTDPDVLA